MYTVLNNYQILIALLKQYGIKHLVLSAGTRNVPFVHTVENDSYFTCYSVVDERSAAYFAMGISQEVNAPVVISCTSSTATTNYLPAITEAHYLGIPLLVLTSDRDPYYLGQLEDQMIDQVGMYGKVVRKCVNLPQVDGDEDFWYCERLVNDALLTLTHKGCGPVQVNIPTYKQIVNFSSFSLPDVKKIERHSLFGDDEQWNEKLKELPTYNRILVIVGQSYNVSSELLNYVELFSEKYNCTVAIDHMSNMYSDIFIEPTRAIYGMSAVEFKEFVPDLIISFDGNFIAQFKNLLRRNYKDTKHWLINEKGDIVDVFKSITDIFECTPLYFFKYFVDNANQVLHNDKEYNNLWLSRINNCLDFNLPFSNVSVIEKFTEKIPNNTILHLSILNSIRITNFFKLPPNVKVSANLGSHGIDGCMSTLLGQSVVSDKLAFLVIGDLSFFYDMNSIRIHHIKNNVRILLINNNGGSEFQKNFLTNADIKETIDQHTAARHNIKAKAWCESVGFKYLTASNYDEYNSCIDEFVGSDSDKPMVLEVMTEMETDAEVLNLFAVTDKSVSGKSKNMVKSVLGPEVTNRLKGFLNK